MSWQDPRSLGSREKMKIQDPRSCKIPDPGSWGSRISIFFGILAHVCYPHFNLIRPVISELQTRKFFKFKDEVCKCARGGFPLLTPLKGWTDGYLATYQIWAQSAEPFWSFSTVKFHDMPSLCTCHALHSTPIWVGIGSTRGRKNVATQERKPFVKRTCGCWAISLVKAWPRPAGRLYWLFSVILTDTSGRYRTRS